MTDYIIIFNMKNIKWFQMQSRNCVFDHILFRSVKEYLKLVYQRGYVK
jgi:hypothetical protein